MRGCRLSPRALLPSDK
uniref:Uncharacterized protein n=1 Tax=Arundo donax TaxID=35708 RepID=A0A0A9AA06_ARUDO